jgi:hypothetical protein
MSEKKERSYKILMRLNALMFALATIHNICNWYTAWLGFIYYSDAPDRALDAPDRALDALDVDETTSLSLHAIGSMLDLLTTLRLGIADSIMVSTHPLLAINTTKIPFNFKVWRCWIIYNRNGRAAIIPLISNIGSIGM